MMRISLLAVFLLFSIFVRAQSAAEKYIQKYDSLAISVSSQYDIPVSLILGIALQESAAGTSKLCRTHHNHFGLKGRVKSSHSRSGYATKYRSFESDEASYRFFGEMISKKKYYSGLKGNKEYMKWLKAMKAAKYATSSSWISHVDKMIKRYNLTRFDVVSVPAVIFANPVSADSLQNNE